MPGTRRGAVWRFYAAIIIINLRNLNAQFNFFIANKTMDNVIVEKRTQIFLSNMLKSFNNRLNFTLNKS